MTDFKIHDKVTWNTSQGSTKGEIVKKMTEDGEYQGLQISASKDDPRYVVRSEATGKVAAHKADALSKA